MTQRNLFSKITLITLIAVPLCVMGLLTVAVLLPSLKDPESKIYASPIGYPALKRWLGQPIKVRTVAVEQQSLQEAVAAPGESVALEEVNISPLIDGAVQEVFVAEGDFVRKGQPLLRIDQAPFRASVETARANVAIAESNLRKIQESDPASLAMLEANLESARQRLEVTEAQFNRLRALEQEGAISAAHLYETQDSYIQRQREFAIAQQELFQNQGTTANALENAQLILDNNQVALQQAMRDLNHTVIYASTDGLISQVKIQRGESASPQMSVITLAQNMVFKAYIDQARLNSINVGDPATIRLVAHPGRTFTGKVIQLNPTVQTEAPPPGSLGADRQYTYSAWVQVSGLDMSPGLQGYAAFDQQRHNQLAIPEDAVTHLSSGQGMVMVVEAGQAVVKRVSLGRVVQGQREVLGGLSAGEEVVVSPRALNPGDQLNPQLAQLSAVGDR